MHIEIDLIGLNTDPYNNGLLEQIEDILSRHPIGYSIKATKEDGREYINEQKLGSVI